MWVRERQDRWWWGGAEGTAAEGGRRQGGMIGWPWWQRLAGGASGAKGLVHRNWQASRRLYMHGCSNCKVLVS